MPPGRNRILAVIAGIVLIIAGYELWFLPDLAKLDRPSPRALVAFATETPTPDCDSICATKLAPTVAYMEALLCEVQSTLIPQLATAIAIIVDEPTSSPSAVASPSATSTISAITPTQIAVPTKTPPAPFVCDRLTADGCARYGLFLKDCGGEYGSVCVRYSNPVGDCTWCKNNRPK